MVLAREKERVLTRASDRRGLPSRGSDADSVRLAHSLGRRGILLQLGDRLLNDMSARLSYRWGRGRFSPCLARGDDLKAGVDDVDDIDALDTDRELLGRKHDIAVLNRQRIGTGAALEGVVTLRGRLALAGDLGVDGLEARRGHDGGSRCGVFCEACPFGLEGRGALPFGFLLEAMSTEAVDEGTTKRLPSQ